MSAEDKNSLVGQYYKWELSVLITSLLLVFWQVFGLADTTAIPLIKAILKDSSKFPHAASIVLAVEMLFLWISWGQSDKSARQKSLSQIQLGIVNILAGLAVWISLPALTKGTDLAGVSTLWF